MGKKSNQTKTEAAPEPTPEEPVAENANQLDLGKVLTGLDTLAQSVSVIAENQAVQQEQINQLFEAQANAETRVEGEGQENGHPETPGTPGELPAGLVTELEDGTVRFFSPYSEYLYHVEPTVYEKIGNRNVPIPGRRAQFMRGIYETKDESMIEALRASDVFGRDFWEDPLAKPHPGPVVVAGVKTTPQSGRTVEAPAEIAARIN